MFLKTDLQPGFGAKQGNSNMVHRHSESLGDLSIALLKVVPPMNQIPISLRQPSNRCLQYFDSATFATRLSCGHGCHFANGFPVRPSQALPAIIPREISGNGAKIGPETSRSTPRTKPAVIVFPYVKQEALIYLFHVLRAQVRLSVQYCGDESTVGLNELVEGTNVP